MNIFRLIGELVVIYILYKVIFDFIVPLYKTTKQMKGKMNDMQEPVRQQQRAQAEAQKKAEQENVSRRQRTASEDYIDYEEIKS